MASYGGPTEKPHWAYCNSPVVERLNRGFKRARDESEAAQPAIKTCEQYVNRDGKVCFKGTSKLKSTQTLRKIQMVKRSFMFLTHHMPHQLLNHPQLLCQGSIQCSSPMRWWTSSLTLSKRAVVGHRCRRAEFPVRFSPSKT